MPNEATSGYAKALYELASNVQRGHDHVYAIILLERLVKLEDPFYSPFALALLAQSYSAIAREDLLTGTYIRVTKLPTDQQVLLNPRWLHLCYLRAGNAQMAATILNEALKINPREPTFHCSLAEILLLEGKFDEASTSIDRFRELPEPKFQILGRMMRGLILGITGKQEESASEFLWVGQFLISNGAVPPDTWDYRDMQPLVEKLGKNSRLANALIDVLMGRTTLQEFARRWSEMTTATTQQSA